MNLPEVLRCRFSAVACGSGEMGRGIGRSRRGHHESAALHAKARVSCDVGDASLPPCPPQVPGAPPALRQGGGSAGCQRRVTQARATNSQCPRLSSCKRVRGERLHALRRLRCRVIRSRGARARALRNFPGLPARDASRGPKSEPVGVAGSASDSTETSCSACASDASPPSALAGAGSGADGSRSCNCTWTSDCLARTSCNAWRQPPAACSQAESTVWAASPELPRPARKTLRMSVMRDAKSLASSGALSELGGGCRAQSWLMERSRTSHSENFGHRLTKSKLPCKTKNAAPDAKAIAEPTILHKLSTHPATPPVWRAQACAQSGGAYHGVATHNLEGAQAPPGHDAVPARKPEEDEMMMMMG